MFHSAFVGVIIGGFWVKGRGRFSSVLLLGPIQGLIKPPIESPMLSPSPTKLLGVERIAALSLSSEVQ